MPGNHQAVKYAAAIVLALGVYALWSIGEPSRQAERAKKAIHTGMSIAEVEGVLTYDRIFRSGADSKNVSAEEFAKALTPPAQGGGQSSSGRLYLTFMGTAPGRISFCVEFDASGKVTGVTESHFSD